MAKKEKLEKGETRDKLVEKVYDIINAGDGEYEAYFLDEDESASEVVDWVSTGDPIIDMCISNRKNGGIHVGRVTEITGLESSGKSLLVAHIIAETQKRGGIGVIIDTEFATDKEFLKAIGVDLSKLVYVNTHLIENVFQIIENIIETVRKTDENKLVTIAVDSIMGTTDESEDEADWGKAGFATQKARVLGKAMRKITSTIANHRIALVLTNQLRTRLGVMFGDPYTTSGGKAIGFHSSLRLRLSQMNKIKIKEKVTGVKTKLVVKKSRLGSMYNECTFDIFFDRGLDAVSAWFDVGKQHKLIIPAKKLEDETKPEGPKNKMKEVKGWFMLDADEEHVRFQLSHFKEIILDDDKKKQILYDGIANAVLLKYRDKNSVEPINKEEVDYIAGEDD